MNASIVLILKFWESLGNAIDGDELYPHLFLGDSHTYVSSQGNMWGPSDGRHYVDKLLWNTLGKQQLPAPTLPGRAFSVVTWADRPVEGLDEIFGPAVDNPEALDEMLKKGCGGWFEFSETSNNWDVRHYGSVFLLPTGAKILVTICYDRNQSATAEVLEAERTARRDKALIGHWM
ncbi:MAG: hypothetical protein HN726_00270 [Candidatus Magasanikbacteria bacterium]|jgi:hypothetical protein|nr:hypothetical protein [Candidatus Magasanikbacteria bacterium]MBT4350594.1 hypothetical protein [Candidatus Magasanikbacteria bacterium]MBT4542107.1 hypothetical protein [Candidatus Magasanikbacteria bacterium]MBT6253229.1 hypothetical protein [Candidatus Magasanikbacteria bacterium]MBT6334981.1 hypothetical protein [Candidatus Magasanikbacteria bacterium]